MPQYPNAAGQKLADFMGNHVSVKMYGAVGDGAADDTAAIQNAINDIAAGVTETGAPGTGTVFFPAGSYKVTDTITWKRGVSLEGDISCVGQPCTYPRILWWGPAGHDMFQTDMLGYSFSFSSIHRLSFCKHSDAPQGPRDIIAYRDRCDCGAFIDEVQLAGAERYGLRYDVGGINVHLRRFRADGCAVAAVYWKQSGNDLMSMDGFTVDNMRPDLATTGSGRALLVDGGSAPDNSYFHFGIRNARIEINTTLPAGQGMFEFQVNPAISQFVQIEGVFDSVDIEPDNATANHTGLLVTPATDYVHLVLMSSRMSVSGIPSWTHPLPNADYYKTYWHIFSVIAPFTVSVAPFSNMSEKSAIAFCTDVIFERAVQLAALTASGLIQSAAGLSVINPAAGAELLLDAGVDGDGNQQSPAVSFAQQGSYLFQLLASWNGNLGVYEQSHGYRLIFTKATGALAHYGANFTTSNAPQAGDNTLTVDAGATNYPTVALSQGGNQLWQWTIGWDGSLRVYQPGVGAAGTRLIIDPASGKVTTYGPIAVQNTSAYHFAGAGSPEGVVTAGVGSIYQRTDGGTGLCLYVKEAGYGNTGWVLYTASAFDSSQYYTKAQVDALLLGKSSSTHTHLLSTSTAHHHTDPQGGNTGDTNIVGFIGTPQ